MLTMLDAVYAERAADDDYAALRAAYEPNAASDRVNYMFAAILDGGDAALARLGLRWSSTMAEAKAAYRKAASVAHPDRGGDAETFAAVTRAWEVVERWIKGRDGCA